MRNLKSEATYLAWVDLSDYITQQHISEPMAKYFIKRAGVIIEVKNSLYIMQMVISELI